MTRGKDETCRRVINHAQAAGWRVSRTKKSHLKFEKAGRPPVFFGGTPGDCRAAQNAIAQLRREDRKAALNEAGAQL